MHPQISFTYLPCQTCSAKIHCEQCADTIAQSLLQINGITHVEVDMAAKQLVIIGSAHSQDVEAYLEDRGVFVN